jgi:two-component system nitrogen regulation sensor histidine kinase GlnL
MPDGVLVLDPRGRVESLNPAAERLFGLKRDEVAGKLYLDVFGDFRAVLNIIDRIFDDPNAAPSYETYIFGVNPEPIPAFFTWSVLSDDKNRNQGIVINIQDLSDVKRLERQSRRNQRLASLGTMAAGVAHEVRNPLGCIRGASQLLLRETQADERVSEFLGIIIKEVDRLDRTVKQLLTFARPSKADMAPANIVSIIEGTLELLKPELAKGNFQLIKKMPAARPLIRADSGQLTQVFLNLFLNALQAMRNEGTLTISVKDDRSFPNTAKAVVVEIKDTGCGMSADVVEQLFTPFFTTRDEGAGLGLALSHRIVQEHGGAIDVLSREGQGTTFIVSFRTI